MINYIYQLINPGAFSVKYSDEGLGGAVAARPKYMAICHADQRYYMGKRDISVLKKKLPMALIHECCAEVIRDDTGTYEKGSNVVLIPNVPPEGFYKKTVYENYAKGSRFLSSGCDGFMREIVCMAPDRVVPFKGIELKIAAISEFVSVAVHAIGRLIDSLRGDVCSVGLWGDGSLSYVVCCCLKKLLPHASIYVIGRNVSKLAQFSFVDGAYTCDSIPKDFEVDHAFECAGGEGSYYAIDDIIKYVNPQGTAVLMGVSENKIAINTRDVLEKGLTLVGSSRSGRKDFEKAVELMENPDFQRRLSGIITEDRRVCGIADIHEVFRNDLNVPFKTVFKWDV